MLPETCIPNPEYLIKSIAEQGYTLETSIADLIDNSVSAGAIRIEVLIDTQKMPFRLFITDNGSGMTPDQLKVNMNFPSSSIEENRNPGDLGRFGLGMKTASFSQTRCFTVISKTPDAIYYSARTWDVNHLKNTGHWDILINTEEEIKLMLEEYRNLTTGFLNSFSDYTPSTIIVWNSLYKYQNDFGIDDAKEILQKELTETTKEYLQLIFHRFMEKENPLKIRLNNEQLKSFNPFPSGARTVAVLQKLLAGSNLRLEGFVLPNRSIAESKESSPWTLSHKSLMDMEGIYIYRGDRLIVYGGWLGVIKKSPRLQLARLKVEIGNGADHLFHLNVAKSSIMIPFGERMAFMRHVSELKKEAEKEFFNYETRISAVKTTVKNIFKKIPTSNGMNLEIDPEFTLLKSFTESLNETQQRNLKIILRMITTTINKIKKVHTEENFTSILEKDGLSEQDINIAVKLLLEDGISKENILAEFIPMMGIDKQSIPDSTLNLLK